MRKIASLFVILFAISTFAGLAKATSPQQPVSEEKKRAMHKLDPIDIFPQVQERGGRERNRDKRASSNDASGTLAGESNNSANSQNSKRGSRRKNSSSETPTNDLAATAIPLPTPTAVSETSSTATSATTPQSQALPVTTSEPQPGFAEKANSASTQTLAAMNTSPLSSAPTVKNSALPLPIILALLVLVLVMLILVFTKLVRYLRNPVS